MGVDVHDVARGEISLAERLGHGQGLGLAGRIGLHHVVRVGGDARRRPARPRSGRRGPGRVPGVSITSTAAPSPSTKPSRSTSQGRDARSGSSLRRLIACIWAKQAIGSGWMQASVPPTTTTSARPSRIMSSPSEMASLLDAQADTGACAPARAPSRMLTLPADALAISIGMASGLTRRDPFSFWTSQLAEQGVQAADAGGDGHAEPVAVDRVVLLQAEAGVAPGLHRRDHAPAGPSGPGAGPRPGPAPRSGRPRRAAAILTGKVVGPVGLDARTPDRPASSASQVLATSPPSGVVAPIPVTTTRVRDMVQLPKNDQDAARSM